MAEQTEPEIVKDILEEEDKEEKHFHEMMTQHSNNLTVGKGMVHSATTDTLDSVYLEPPNPEPDGDSDLNLDLAFQEASETTDKQDEAVETKPGEEFEGKKEATEVEFSIEGGTTEVTTSGSVPSLSKYFGKEGDNETDPFATDLFANIQESDQSIPADMPKVGTDSSLEGRIEDAVNDMIDLTLDDSKDILDNSDDNDTDMNLNNNQKAPDDLNVESVNFDLALDKNETIETPVDIEEKDAFESFTADIADTEALDALGMSPAAPSFMSEKNIKDYFRQTSNQSDSPFNNISRQISHTSAKSTSSQDRNSANLVEVKESEIGNMATVTNPAPLETTDTSIPAPDIPLQAAQSEVSPVSAETTPRHQPSVPPPPGTLSPGESPMHQPFLRQTSLQSELLLFFTFYCFS